MDNVKGFFEHPNLEILVAEVEAVKPYLETVATDSEIVNLVIAAKLQDFDAFIKAMQAADNESGLTLHNRIDIQSISKDLTAKVDPELPSMAKALEILTMYEMFEDNNYSGLPIANIAFISVCYFQAYKKHEAIENGWVSDDLIECVDWAKYADNKSRQYGSVTINCPMLLGEALSGFYFSMKKVA